MLLTREKILEERNAGNIIIDPYCQELVSINSVDVRLGPDLWKLDKQKLRDVYAPKDEDWTKVLPASAWAIRRQYEESQWAPHLSDDTQCFIFESGQFYLATTLERIGVGPGTAERTLVPRMSAKSTTGRQGLTVAVCAGLGDSGYCSRWAMEVRVVDCGDIPLAIGTPLGQITFEEAYPTKSVYNGVDRYQDGERIRFLPKALRVIL